MKFVLVFSCLSFVSCASLSSDSTTSGPYAPESVQNDQRTGKVIYNPHGLKELVEMRRESALKQIYEHCGNTNKYKIAKEYTTTPDKADGSLATVAADEIQVIEFECEKRTAKN